MLNNWRLVDGWSSVFLRESLLFSFEVVICFHLQKLKGKLSSLRYVYGMFFFFNFMPNIFMNPVDLVLQYWISFIG